MDVHNANRAFWNASVDWWKKREEERGLWMRAHADPSLVLSPEEMTFLDDLDGKEACVLGSGDNEVAFALSGLGAQVTSVDISERRLEVAEERARTLGIELTFLRQDVTDLAAIDSDVFDLVYTGGHMSVWISDIQKYYREAVRILRPGDLFMVNEYHPIRRVWLDSDGIEPKNRYFNRGPYRYDTKEDIPTFEFHWTVADHIQAVIDAGCRLLKVDEQGEKLEEEFWMKSNLDKLPGFLMIVGRKDQPFATSPSTD